MPFLKVGDCVHHYHLARGPADRPALVLCGDQDIATPPELGRELARANPHAQFSLIEQAGHITCVEQPEAVAYRMMQFFKEANLV